MTEPSDTPVPNVSPDELTLYAFGELPPDRRVDVERFIDADPHARATVAAMQRIARLASEDDAAPSDATGAAARATVRLAVRRRLRRRRLRVAAAVGAAGLAAAVVLVTTRPGTAPSPATSIAQAPQSVSKPAAGLTDADRKALREVYATVVRRRTWEDPLDEEVAALQRRVRAARLSYAHVWPAPSRSESPSPRMKESPVEPRVAPKATRPAGSTRRTATTKEMRHA